MPFPLVSLTNSENRINMHHYKIRWYFKIFLEDLKYFVLHTFEYFFDLYGHTMTFIKKIIPFVQ